MLYAPFRALRLAPVNTSLLYALLFNAFMFCIAWSCGARNGSSKSKYTGVACAVLTVKRRAYALAGALPHCRPDRWRSCTTVKPPVAGAGVAPGPPSPGAIAGAGTATLAPPAAPREFRAAWVSTVANIDWPSKPNLNAGPAAGRGDRHPRPRQGDEPERDRAAGAPERRRDLPVEARAVDRIPDRRARQGAAAAVRPAGVLGRPQAHARGLELHAWFNPYRARQSARQVAGVAPTTSPRPIRPR